MRTVVVTTPGVLEINFMWLPTWIGSNAVLKKRLEENLRDRVVGRVLSEQSLDEINDLVIDALEELNPSVEGLRDYLDGLKFVKFTCRELTGSTSE